MQFVRAKNIELELGESPFWCDKSRLLYFSDIKAKKLYSYNPLTEESHFFDLEEEAGFIGRNSNGGFVSAMRSGIYLLDEYGKKHKLLAKNPENIEISRFNDGCIDAKGRLFIGTYDEEKKFQKANLYRLDSYGLKAIKSNITNSNGLGFSPDNKILYHTNTPSYEIYCHDFDLETGEIGIQKTFAKIAHDENNRGRPDGAAIDKDGNYYSAMYEGARIEVFNSLGENIETLKLAAKNPTMPCFGGQDLQILFVTTAREANIAGGLYFCHTNICGLLKNIFKQD